MRNMDIVLDNIDMIIDDINVNIKAYGLRLTKIELYNCIGETYDIIFIYSGNTHPSYDERQYIERASKYVMREFVLKYIHTRYAMNQVSFIYND